MKRLLIRPGAIGDIIVSLPALEHLRAEETEVWTTEKAAPLIRFADRVRSIASTGLDLLELGLAPDSLIKTLADFDDIVSWYGTARPAFRDATRGLPIRFFDALPVPGIHATDFYARQVSAPLGLSPRLPVERRGDAFIAGHAWSGSARKNWPGFAELARRIPIEWCEWPEGRHRYADLWDLAQWLAGARLYIGNDSGITHLAAAVGVPVVALFGPTDPAVWAPRGARVLFKDPLESLRVEEVERVMLECLRCAS